MPPETPIIRAFQWDLARQTERLDWLLAQLPRYAAWGYQELYLHLEDAVEFPSLPQVSRRGAYTYQQFGRLVAAADQVGIKVVPIVNLWGHTQYLIKVPELRDLNELRNADGSPQETGQICPLHPRTLEIAEKLLRDMAPFCTAGKVHVGLDESFHLGKHPLSAREISRIGRAAHFARYVTRLRRLTKKLDLRMGIWADMLYFLPEAIPLLPKDLIAYDWYYYPFARLPKVELFNYAERDLATPLQAHGIEYWGCPMNGGFRHEPLPHFRDRLTNLQSWWRRCHEVKAGGFLVTSWEASRLAIDVPTMVDAAAAELWLNPAKTTVPKLLAAGLQRTDPTGNSTHKARALLAADRHAFTGYARGEINKRWSLGADLDDLDQLKTELSFFEDLTALHPWPAPLASSLELRHYFAERDHFVGACRQSISRLRRMVSKREPVDSLVLSLRQDAQRFDRASRRGALASLRMWQLSRRASERSPYDEQFRRDKEQLVAWKKWLTAVRRSPKHAETANPIGGAWQLTYTVLNYAPAVQKVGVEQCVDGRWCVLKECHTIEFRSSGARPRASIQHRHTAPLIESSGTPESIDLRFTVSGIGSVKIGRVSISNGIETYSARIRGWRTVGGDAPASGWPDLDQRAVFRPEFAIPVAS